MIRVVLFLAITSVGVLAAKGPPKQGVTKEPGSASAQIAKAPGDEQRDPKVTVIVKRENATPKPNNGAQNPDENIQESNLRLTGCLVIVGIVQAVILYFTIRAINEQTGTSQHIERAWVMVELRCGPETFVSNGESTEDGATKLTVAVMGAEMHCTNDGNSPAWITEKSARVMVVGDNGLPLVPIIGPSDVIQNRPDPLGPGRDSIFKWDAEGEGRHSPLHFATIIYGVVRYRDIFQKDRETWFCYQMIGYKNSRKLVRVAAPPAYNKNT